LKMNTIELWACSCGKECQWELIWINFNGTTLAWYANIWSG